MTYIFIWTKFGLIYLMRLQMKMSEQIKPISYLKAHASDVVRQLQRKRQPLFITQNGEAKMVVQDIESYEKTQEALALLKILALGNRQVEDKKLTSADSAIRHIRKRRKRQQ